MRRNWALILSFGGLTILGAPAARGATGQDAIKSARQDWKAQARGTVKAHATSKGHASSSGAVVHQKTDGMGPVPANFGRLSPEARLSYLLARYDLDRARFARYHTHLTPFLAADERLRAAQSTNCRPLLGLLPDTAHNRYLQYRRSLGPANFDLYHPTIGAILAENDRLRTGAGCVGGVIIPPTINPTPTPGTPSPGPPIGGGGVSVPEPASVVLLAIGAVGAVSRGVISRRKRLKAEASA